MKTSLFDEYQDARSAGSLVKARGCWLDLVVAGALPLPQRFTFVFGCPTERMAAGLTEFLRYAAYAGFVRSTDDIGAAEHPWQVTGTTSAAVWSLASLEHLFMRLRGAGTRYDSTLATLDLQTTNGDGVTDALVRRASTAWPEALFGSLGKDGG